MGLLYFHDYLHCTYRYEVTMSQKCWKISNINKYQIPPPRWGPVNIYNKKLIFCVIKCHYTWVSDWFNIEQPSSGLISTQVNI